jgi:hypothetical protein
VGRATIGLASVVLATGYISKSGSNKNSTAPAYADNPGNQVNSRKLIFGSEVNSEEPENIVLPKRESSGQDSMIDEVSALGDEIELHLSDPAIPVDHKRIPLMEQSGSAVSSLRGVIASDEVTEFKGGGIH